MIKQIIYETAEEVLQALEKVHVGGERGGVHIFPSNVYLYVDEDNWLRVGCADWLKLNPPFSITMVTKDQWEAAVYKKLGIDFRHENPAK